METINRLYLLDILDVDPICVFISRTLEEILELSSVRSGLEYFIDLVHLFAINNHRLGWVELPVFSFSSWPQVLIAIYWIPDVRWLSRVAAVGICACLPSPYLGRFEAICCLASSMVVGCCHGALGCRIPQALDTYRGAWKVKRPHQQPRMDQKGARHQLDQRTDQNSEVEFWDGPGGGYIREMLSPEF